MPSVPGSPRSWKFYLHASRPTGITRYSAGPHSIAIEFKDGGKYLYNERHPGKRHVEAMKKPAAEGKGLATYINQHVRKNYAARL